MDELGDTATGTAASTFDPTELLARCEGDVDLAKQLVQAFRDERPRMFRELHDGVASGDSSSTARAAHALKGSVGVFGDPATHDSALALEHMGLAGNLAAASAELGKLEAEVARLERDLASFVGDTGTP